MGSAENTPKFDSDQEYLDAVFEQIVEGLEAGLPTNPTNLDQLVAGREHLRAAVGELIEVAKGVAVGPVPQAQLGPLPVVPGYTILHEIGRGGMGVVYLARQDRLGGRRVALKVLSSVAMQSPRARQRFRAEAHAIARFRHDHIVAVYDIVQSDDCHAFAMEWIDGTSMAAVIHALKEMSTRGPSSGDGDAQMGVLRSLLGAPPGLIPGRTWTLYVICAGIAMARAMEAVHAAGLLHRDVKPSNILIRRDGTPLLSDFGLVRETDSSITRAGTFVGTLGYASPEQLRGHDQLDRRSDIFSLGATLYHALSLRMPHDGASATQILQQIERSTAPPLRRINQRIPIDLQTVIGRAMDPEPGRRYPSAREFADDLQRVLDLQPIRARPAGPLTRTAKLLRRNRTTLSAGIVGGALAVCLVALVLLYALGLPAWSRAHFTHARLVLLDPEQSDAMISAAFSNDGIAGGLPLASAAIDHALAEYESAIRYAPFDAEIARERELISLVGVVTNRPAAAPIHFAGNAVLPLTGAFLSQVHSGWRDYRNSRQAVEFSSEQLRSASSEDLRALGLVALLCGATHTCVEAWSIFDVKADADPLVDAAFGMALRASKQWERAYPRLRHAVEAYPNVGFLTVNLAEAAMKCGDFAKAQGWLEQARDKPRHDRFNGWKRVQASLHAATGKDDEARRLYEELFAENTNVVAVDEYAQFLVARGDVERALIMYLHCIGHGVIQRDLFTRYIGTVERWWGTLDEDDRKALIDVNEPLESFRTDRGGILPTYHWCIRQLGRAPPAGAAPHRP